MPHRGQASGCHVAFAKRSIGAAGNRRQWPRFEAICRGDRFVVEKFFENQRPQSIDEFAALISGAAPIPASIDLDEATRIWKADGPSVAQPVSTRLDPPVAPAPPAAAAPPPQNATRMKPAYLGMAAAALLVIGGGGWFVLHSASVSPPAAEEARSSDTAAEQLAGAGLIPPPAASSPSEQSPSSPNVAAGSSAPAVPPATALPPSEPAPARPNVAPGPQLQASREQTAPQPPPAPSIRASFDCAKARNDAERLICADRELAALDVRMADLYQQGLSSVVDTNEFSGEQMGWLSVRNGCADKQCLIVSYNDRIKDLQRWIRR